MRCLSSDLMSPVLPDPLHGFPPTTLKLECQRNFTTSFQLPHLLDSLHLCNDQLVESWQLPLSDTF